MDTRKDILEKLGINLAAAISYLIAGVIAFSRLSSNHEALATEFHESKLKTQTTLETMMTLLIEIKTEQAIQSTRLLTIEEDVKENKEELKTR